MNLKAILTLAIANICSLQFALAVRVAPSLPEAQTLKSGSSYYLYNVIEGKFACHSTTSYSYAAIGTYGEKITVTATSNTNEYTIQWANDNYYWEAYNSYISCSSYLFGNSDYFTIVQSSKGYTIQRSPRNTAYYKSDEFVGFDGSNGDHLSPALPADGSIHWQMISVGDAEYYFAKHKLYTYLELADQYNFYVAQYDAVYNNPTSTKTELDQAKLALKNALELSQSYVSPTWSEYPILFQNSNDKKWRGYDDYINISEYSDGTEFVSTLTAVVNVDTDATLAYTYSTSNTNNNLYVFLDGKLVQNITATQASTVYWYGQDDMTRRYYIELTPGKHDISWTYSVKVDNNTYLSCSLREIGIQNTPTISTTTTVEGQLGTEVLRLVDPVSSVKKIIINGVIGTDDWTTIGLMVNAFSIDMSGATSTVPLPESMFTKSNFPFLHSVKLPQGLTAIGRNAFYQSDIEGDINMPATLKTIAEGAFYNTKITSAIIPNGVTSIGSSIFESCYFLEQASIPATAGIIPSSCFRYCHNLRTFKIPEGITEIGSCAFMHCWCFNPRFPTSMSKIEYDAFQWTPTDSLFVTEKMTVQSNAFRYCGNLVYAEWPTNFASASYNTDGVVANCSKLNKVKLMSPTVLANTTSFFDGNTMSDITLIVPDFLVSAYKLDPYWYQCNLQGFSSADIKDWQVSQPLTLNPGQRIGGTPNLMFHGNSSLTVLGDDAQTIGDMSIEFIPFTFLYYNNKGYSDYKYQHIDFMLSHTKNVNISGELSESIYTEEKTWYFLTLPFDTKVGNIVAKDFQTDVATSFAIRYYDGGNRAKNGTGDNWKNYTANDIIPAGTGFIYQTAKAAVSKFVAQDNASKQHILSNKEFVKALVANHSNVTANKGWNLVGNPWQTYYNIHKLNFIAPITVWNMDNRKYEAYSIIDDDYAIKPLEAFFVQCPDELSELTFPIDGRQLTDKIESQSASRSMQPTDRLLVDVVLSNNEHTDRTRFVFNPAASMDYELNRDASKFMSMDSNVPQIYTLEQGERLAINERPLGNGNVLLGMQIASDGTYTISSPRCQFEHIFLVDQITGAETDLAHSDYTFSAFAGTYDSRFLLRFDTGITQAIALPTQQTERTEPYYNLNGQRISTPQKGLYILRPAQGKNRKKVLR